MIDGKTVFTQLFEHIPVNNFRKSVRRYHGEYKVPAIQAGTFWNLGENGASTCEKGVSQEASSEPVCLHTAF